MKKIKIPGTAIESSAIAYGCMNIGKQWNKEPLSAEHINDAEVLVKTAFEEGINFFDHADIYALGKSELVFGEVLRRNKELRDKIYIQTKCGIRFADEPAIGAPHRYDFSYQHIVNSVNKSLERLNTEYIDILLLHRPDPLVEPEEVARAFDELKSSGKVNHFGLSNHDRFQIELLKKYVNQPIIINQLELNVFHSDLIEEGIVVNQMHPMRPVRNLGTLEYCRLNDILIQAWAPLAKGKFLESQEEKSTKTIEVASHIAEEKGVSIEAVFLAWILRHPAGIQPVIGTTKADRIKAGAQAAAIQLSREEWYSLFTAGRGIPLP